MSLNLEVVFILPSSTVFYEVLAQLTFYSVQQTEIPFIYKVKQDPGVYR